MSTASEHTLIACHDCDLLHRTHPLRYGERAKCSRCGALLYQKKRDSLDRTVTLSLTALILFILANVYPFMTFKLQGRVQESYLITGVEELYVQGFMELSVLVLLTSILLPLVKILGTLYILLPLKLNRRPWKAPQIFRFIEALGPWVMMEVYLLGVIVAYVKLIDMATIVLGIALYSFAALIVLVTAAGMTLDPDEVWERLETTS
ncbi:MAG: paraquat-inducible protein A [Deltaproteobacteria bacterium]|nr:paraquat-inducible protein A [Deltaproteobacteria bacterium]